MTKLSTKREQFALEYVIDLNAKQAAIRAGYAPGSAEVTASRLLSDAKVAARIQELMAERQRRTEITADATLRDLRLAADVGMGRVPARRVLRARDPKTGDVHAHEVEVREVNLHGAIRALELLGRHQGLWQGEQGDSNTLVSAFWRRMEEHAATSTPAGRIRARLGRHDDDDDGSVH